MTNVTSLSTGKALTQGQIAMRIALQRKAAMAQHPSMHKVTEPLPDLELPTYPFDK